MATKRSLKKKELIDIINDSDFTIKRTCEILKLNLDRFYHWRSRFNQYGIKGLEKKKSTPSSCPHSLLD